MGISTHILDTALGRPAAGVPVTLERQSEDGDWKTVAVADSDRDGRVPDLASDRDVESGRYRLVFGLEGYYSKGDSAAFFPVVELSFVVSDPTEHYHVPLLVSPFGYTTYRGS